MLIDLDMRKIFSNACDVRRDAPHTHSLEKDSGNELEEKATRAVYVAGCDTTRHEVIARSSSVNCNSIQCDQLGQSHATNKAIKCAVYIRLYRKVRDANKKPTNFLIIKVEIESN